MKAKVRFSYAQYEEMVRLGLLDPRLHHRVELIFGRVIPVYGKSWRCRPSLSHEDVVDEMLAWSFDHTPTKAVRVRVKGSFAIELLHSLPRPDITWLTRDDYSNEWPRPGNVLLVVEVSDQPFAKDRGRKARLYALAGIRDYWIVNVQGRCIEVHRNPGEGRYQDVRTFHPGQEIHPLAFPEASLPVARIFPD